MSSRYSKRGKNPGAVDSWLDSLGYYRKNIAYDETCLFRAVSEQLFYTQINHEQIRSRVIEYASSYHNGLKEIFPNKREWRERLKKLSVHMVVCTEVEIRLISLAYKIDLNVFDAGRRQMHEYRYNKNKQSDPVVQICRLGEDHYDAIYDKEHIINTGFCQSIVYSILYENVFQLPNVLSTVNAMLHDKDGALCIYYAEENNNNNNEEIVSPNSPVVLAPFPFKVAKALDPNMYRNIEYDSWLETRREFRLGEWYYGDDNFILGTRCLVNIGSEEYQCYIQEFLQNRRCTVFITKLAKRITVSYDELRREDDAKPWPLPYRFARSTLPSAIPATETVDSGSKGFRKRRDKKRSEVNSSNNTNVEDAEANSFEGCPLVKQESNDVWMLPRPKLTLQITNTNALNNNEDWSISETQPQPCNTGSASSDYYISLPNNTESPLQTTATYQGETSDNPVVYSFNQEYSYPSIPLWSNPPYSVSPDADIPVSEGNTLAVSPDSNRNTQQKFIYCTNEPAYSSPVFLTPVPSVAYGYTDRSVCNTPVAPVGTPRFEVYPFVYSPVPIPTTPVYYPQSAAPPNTTYTPVISSLPPQRPQDYIYSASANSPMPIFNAPYELQYYSNTPSYPSGWSYSHLNPQQGFIFPTPVAPNYV